MSSPSSLRKRILLSTSIKTMISSVASLGATTPLGLEKTDSVINLTKPLLYGIYNDNLDLNLNKDHEDNEDTVFYVKPKPDLQQEREQQSSQTRPSALLVWVKCATKVATVGVAAFVYNMVTNHIHNNHIQTNRAAFAPLFVTSFLINNFIYKLRPFQTLLGNLDYQNTDTVCALLLQGLIMSLAHPVLDRVLPKVFSKRVLSLNPNPDAQLTNATLLNDLIRLLITFLGISYAIRKIEWASTLQVLVVWAMLNPGLWLLLDGTASGFLASLVTATLACVSVYVQNTQLVDTAGLRNNDNVIAIWLWVGSFFFCGMTIFGKLGRCMFGQYR